MTPAAKIRINTVFMAVLAVSLLGSTGPAQAAPVITGFSSQGGNPTNKAGPADRMYLVTPGDQITFSVTATGATAYEWQVNKVVQPAATGNSFTWTAPNAKGIWEIHLTAAGGGTEAHAEWVVSTLSADEAPDFFDYFTDKSMWQGRKEKDPWGRELPEWKFKNTGVKGSVQATNGYLRAVKVKGSKRKTVVRLKAGIPVFNYGTMRFLLQQKFIPGTSDKKSNGVDFAIGTRKRGTLLSASPYLDMHQYFHFLGGTRFSDHSEKGKVNYYLSAPIINSGPTVLNWNDEKWHEVKIIRHREQGFVALFYDDELLPECYGTPNGNVDINADSLFLELSQQRRGKNGLCKTAFADGIEIYRDKYLLPPAQAYLGEFPRGWGKDKRMKPIPWGLTKGLILRGRKLTLQRISDLVGKRALFEYNPETKTAIAHTSLSLRGGSELIMDGETLLMDSKPGRELYFRVQNCATVRLNRSVVKSTGETPYYWSFTNAVNREVYGDALNGLDTNTSRFHHNSHVWFIARDTTFKNTGYFFFDAPAKLVLDNVKFIDLVAADHGREYDTWRSAQRIRKPVLDGPKSLWFFNGMPLEGFTVKNIELKGKGGASELNILCFLTESETPIRDSVLENVKVKRGFSYDNYADPGPLPKKMGGKASLVNCKFKKINVATELASLAAKYYLDVLVVDANKRPVRGASVRVTNDQDAAGYYVHSLERYRKGVVEKGLEYEKRVDNRGSHRGVYKFDRWFLGRKLSSVLTAADGHTPAPKEEKNTVVLTDFVQDKSGKTEFTYTITVEKDGRKKTITGVNPGSAWYRSDPNVPTHTITAVLDGKAVTEAELKGKGLAGSPAPKVSKTLRK